MAIQKAIQKSGILSPWRNPLAPGDRFYRRVLTRAILNLNGTQYATLSEPVVLDGDFEIEQWIAPAGVDFLQLLSGTGDTFNIRADDSLILVLSGSVVSVFPVTVVRNKINRVVLKRTGLVYEVSVNGSSASYTAVELRSFSIETVLGHTNYGTPSHFNGFSLSTMIWKNGDRNTGQLVNDLRFDQSDTIHQRDYSKPVGSYSTFTPDVFVGGWVDNGDGSYTYTGEDNEQVLDSDFTEGQYYEIEFTITNMTTGSLEWKPGNEATISSFKENGTHRAYIPASYAGIRFTAGFADGGRFDGTVSNIKTRPWSGAILHNSLPGDWEKISKKVTDDFWLGVELADQSVATLPGEYFGGGSDQYWYWDIAPLNNGDTVLIRSTMSGNQSSLNPCGWSGQTGIPATSDWRDLGGGFTGSVPLGGVHTSTSSDGIAARVFCSSDPDTDITFTNISVKRYLEYAEGAL